MSQQQTVTDAVSAPTESEVEAAVVEREPNAVTSELEDVFGDPEPEEMVIQPSSGDAAPAVDAQHVDPSAPAEAVTPADPMSVQEAVAIETPEQLEDGSWKMGKFRGTDLADLVVKMNKARDHAERYAGQKSPDEPFTPLDPEDDFTDDVFDISDLQNEVVSGAAEAIAAALNQQSAQVQQQSPQLDDFTINQMQSQVIEAANVVVNDPDASEQAYQNILQNMLMWMPSDKASRDQVLEAWAEQPGQRIKAINAAMEIDKAVTQYAQNQVYAQQRAEEEAMLELQRMADLEAEGEKSENEAAYEIGKQLFVQKCADWPTRNAGMNAFLSQNNELMVAAKGNPKAVAAVMEAAYHAAPQYAAAGVSGVASELQTNMSNVTVNHTPDPAAQAAAIALQNQQVDWATLEQGAGPDGGVDIAVANPGLATDEVPLGDVIGIPLVS